MQLGGENRRKSGFSSQKRNKLIFFICIVALPILQFCIFYICVNINSILLAFKTITMQIGSDGRPFYQEVFGLETIKTVFKDIFGGATVTSDVWKNTFTLFLSKLCVGMLLSLLFSYYIFKKFVGSNLFKVILFLPSVVSGLVLIIMYKYFVVEVLPTFFPKMPDLLDVSGTDAFYTILCFGLITGFGTSVMMYVGGMNNISESVLEYAKIDGVTPIQEFVYIIFPLIYPTFTTFVVINLASVFTDQMRLFDFYGNTAEMHLRTLGYHLYAGVQKAGSDITKYPYYSAMGIIFTLITVPVTLGVKSIMTKFGPGVD